MKRRTRIKMHVHSIYLKHVWISMTRACQPLSVGGVLSIYLLTSRNGMWQQNGVSRPAAQEWMETDRALVWWECTSTSSILTWRWLDSSKDSEIKKRKKRGGKESEWEQKSNGVWAEKRWKEEEWINPLLSWSILEEREGERELYQERNFPFIHWSVGGWRKGSVTASEWSSDKLAGARLFVSSPSICTHTTMYNG